MLVIAYEGAELLDIACPTDVLDAANRHGARPGYEIELATLGGAPVRCSSGLTLDVRQRLEHVTGSLDTVIVIGGWGHERAAADHRMIAQLRRLAACSRRVASVCTGAFLLAAAGLLDGRRATTHWAFAERLAEAYPAVQVDAGPIFVREGDVYTAAGVTSGLDLALSFVTDDHGPELARAVARSLIAYLQRPGEQDQVSMFLAAPTPEKDFIRSVVAYVEANPAQDLGVAALAKRFGHSARHLTRLFAEHLGVSPSRYVRTVRSELARRLLASTGLPLAAVARRCGFGSTETLRKTFVDQYGTSPSAYRKLRA
ncbi:GlxA family transcriptional regulator [Allokutzneria sp. NRRL B-24872]|uniref:GlxA family transcriptional regulator n=1 Tax=Allokutzneria sp. NRRL B-24872 TaxID=1137961 RepID=UPI001FEDCFFD|nr:DJ-1/PfpI family protein [Allokutzneria sp. NRRL B-24872]